MRLFLLCPHAFNIILLLHSVRLSSQVDIVMVRADIVTTCNNIAPGICCRPPFGRWAYATEVYIRRLTTFDIVAL